MFRCNCLHHQPFVVILDVVLALSIDRAILQVLMCRMLEFKCSEEPLQFIKPHRLQHIGYTTFKKTFFFKEVINREEKNLGKGDLNHKQKNKKTQGLHLQEVKEETQELQATCSHEEIRKARGGLGCREKKHKRWQLSNHDQTNTKTQGSHLQKRNNLSFK